MSTNTSINIPKNFNQEEALRVLIVAIYKAQSKGAYNFDEAAILSRASRTLMKTEDGESVKSNIPKELSQEEALRILIGAVKKGQSKGIYTIETASALSKAVKTFAIKPEEVNSESSKLKTITEEDNDNDNNDDDSTIVI